MIKYTDWFENEKPAKVGVYQRMFQIPRYSYWDGRRWHYSALSPNRAMDLKGIPTSIQNLPWRGLAEKP